MGVAGLAISVLLAGRLLVPHHWNVSTFVAFGQDAAPTLVFGRSVLGDIDARADEGHDGKFFFVQAMDPLLLDPSTYAVHLDHAEYRAQRMLYPLLAGAFGVFGPWGVAWGLLIVNLLAMGAGTWGAARLAKRHGGSSWWGLAFVLNLGLISSLYVDGSGIVAFALVIWAVDALELDRFGVAVALLTGAGLTREVMLVAVMGLGFLWWRTRRRLPVTLLVVPALAVGLWTAYVRLRVGGGGGVSQMGVAVFPFTGLVAAARGWLHDPLSLVVGLIFVGVLVAFTWRAVRSDFPLAWATIGFVPMAALLSGRVWTEYFDISRALAPVLTAYVLLAFATRPRRAAGETDPAGALAARGTPGSRATAL